ncbi:MAG: CvpA family protein [Campylobacterales bacterium]|nr:CvpA family protein [Campylobacterales bacterium]
MFLFDIVLIAGIISGFYYGYKHGIHERLYELFRFFMIISFAEMYSVKFGVFLTKLHILWADSFSILKLIGFILLLAVFWFVFRLFEYLFKIVFKTSRQIASQFGGAIITAFSTAIVITLSAFFLTQVKFLKEHLKPVLMDSYSYGKINRFYRKSIDNSFVENVVNGEISGKDAKELIFKTLTAE